VGERGPCRKITQGPRPDGRDTPPIARLSARKGGDHGLTCSLLRKKKRKKHTRKVLPKQEGGKSPLIDRSNLVGDTVGSNGRSLLGGYPITKLNFRIGQRTGQSRMLKTSVLRGINLHCVHNKRSEVETSGEVSGGYYLHLDYLLVGKEVKEAGMFKVALPSSPSPQQP